MQFVTVSDFKTSPANIWKKLKSEHELIITNNGKPIALLTPISDETLEDTLSEIRRARAIGAMKKMQEQSIKNGTNKMTLKEINKEISLARKERKNKSVLRRNK